MKLTVLVENHVSGAGLRGEHGLSLCLELSGRRVMLDTGQSTLFADNARRLGLSLDAVDVLVLSHGHYDHTGGLPLFLAENRHAEVYAGQGFFDPKYRTDGSFIGVPELPAEQAGRVRQLSENREILPGVWVIPAVAITDPEDTHGKGLLADRGSGRVPDDFREECFVAAMEGDSLTVLTGCSHRGVTNIVRHAASVFGRVPDTVIGGFHFGGEPELLVRRWLAVLKELGVRRIGPGHCTGTDGWAFAREMFGVDAFYPRTGGVWEF